MYHALSPVQAVALAATALAAIYTLELLLVSVGLGGVPAVAITYIAVAVGVIVHAQLLGDRALVGLASARARFWLAGLLVGSSIWYIDLRVIEWLEPPGDTTVLERAVVDQSLPIALVAIALLPAVTEELVFRGVLARGLATRLPRPAAVAISAALFAGYHIVPAQMVAVFPLGLALGYIAVRANSVAPTILAHLANNVIVIVATRGGLGALDRAPPQAVLGVAIVLTASGLALAATGPA